MIIYIILVFTIALFAYQETGNKTANDIKNFRIGLLLYLLVVGLRYRHGDYGTYEMGYYTFTDVGDDWGYYQLQLLFARMGAPFELFVFSLTLVSVVAFHQTFRLSNWANFGLLMILGKIFTLYSMSGIRQYMAMAVCWWGVSELLINKRDWLFFVMIIIAQTLHGSAVILLPIYFFKNREFTYKTAAIIFVVSLIAARSSSAIFGEAASMSEFVDDRFGGYVQQGEGGMNPINYVENLLILFLGIKVRKKVLDKIPYYDFFLYMFVIYIGFLIVGSDIGIIKRLRDYYSLAYAFIIPGIYYLKDDKKTMKTVMILYFILLFFRSLYVYDSAFEENTYNKMIPYHSILQKP